LANIVLKLTALELAHLIPDLDRIREPLEVFTGDAFVNYRPQHGTLTFLNGVANVTIESGEQLPVPNPGDAWTFVSLLTYQQLLGRIGEAERFVRADVIPDFGMTWHDLGKRPHKVLVRADLLITLQSYLVSIRTNLRARA